jgi:predicted dienelactone hydrolase
MDDGDKEYGALAQQATNLVFPLGNVFSDGGFAGWVTKVPKERCKDMNRMLDLQTRLSKLYEQCIRPIEEYEFPMVTLNEGTSGPAVRGFRFSNYRGRTTSC